LLQLYFFSSTSGLKNIEEKEVSRFIGKKAGFVWADLYKPTIDDIKILKDKLKIHPESLDLLINSNFPGVFDLDDNSRAFILRIPLKSTKAQTYSLNPIGVIIGRKFIVILRQSDFPWVDSLKSSLEKNPSDAGDSPLELLVRLIRRIAREVRYIGNGWENASSDFTADELPLLKEVTLRRLLKMKQAAEELFGSLSGGCEVLRELYEEMEKDIKEKEERISFKRVIYLWEDVTEQIFDILQNISNAARNVQVLSLQKVRRSMGILTKAVLLLFPIIVILLVVQMILPSLALEYHMKVYILPFISVLLGAIIGTALVGIFNKK
jgi:Mg2+ and Co2+ transporter CorA